MDRDGFRQIQMESDRFRWIQMDSNGFKLTGNDSGEMATLGGRARMAGSRAYLAQQPWIQNLTLRLFLINQGLLHENTAFTNISPPERTYFLGEFMSLVVMRRPFVSVGSSLICRSNESSIFFGFLILGKLHQTSSTILHLTS